MGSEPRPVIDEPPPLNRGYNKDPHIKALHRRGFTNHGSTLPKFVAQLEFLGVKGHGARLGVGPYAGV